MYILVIKRPLIQHEAISDRPAKTGNFIAEETINSCDRLANLSNFRKRNLSYFEFIGKCVLYQAWPIHLFSFVQKECFCWTI